MRLKLAVVVAFVLIACGAAVLFSRKHSTAPNVNVTFRIAVDPADRTPFVIEQADSAKFKYLVGKKSGVKPVFAQRLSVKPVPGKPLVESRIGVETRDQAARYIEAFMQILEWQCKGQAKLTLEEQSVR